ncbi:MAG: hypothetical protein IT285_04595 [Bdellovibrionales bacterium]|nr:hypothetical protein [Bdellovibrionales bacterium]
MNPGVSPSSTTSGRAGRKPRVAFVVDRRLTRERRAHLSAALTILKRTATLDVWETEEEENVLEKLSANVYQLVLVPWFLYLKWTRIEGAFGLARVGGPVFAGYAGEPLDTESLQEIPPYQRLLLLDLSQVTAAEAAHLMQALCVERGRTGIRALVSPQANVYTENWPAGTPLGPRLDALSSIPELGENAWAPRLGAIRGALGALWSLVFEEGPGKAESAGAVGVPKACLQLAADSQTLTLRLFYSLKGSHIKKLIEGFWPNREISRAPLRSAAQVLLRDADFLRVQAVQETQDVEIVAGFLKSAASELPPRHARTLWIEPVAPSDVLEVPFEAPGPESGLKAMPVLAQTPGGAEDAETSRRKDKMLREAIDRLTGLKRQLLERDKLIQELRMGGVSTAAPPPPPDAEGLLGAFEHHYHEAELELRDITERLRALEAGAAPASDVEPANLKRRMEALAKRETEWMRTLARLLSAFKQARAGRSAG